MSFALKALFSPFISHLPPSPLPPSFPQNLKKLGGSSALLSSLSTSQHSGIDSSTIQERISAFGANFTPSPPPPTFFSLLVDSVVEDVTVQILIVSAIVSLAVGIYDDPETGWIEGAAIIAAVVIVAFVTATNDYQKEQQFRKLEDVSVSAKDVKALRDGLTIEISQKDVVVGDVILLEPGDKIPADGVLISSDAGGVVTDESSLTGEVDGVEKHVLTGTSSKVDPFALSGCNVVEGSGSMVVIATGRNSQWGRIKAKLESEHKQTPLQEKLDDMAAMIGYIGMAAAGATFIALMGIRYTKRDELPSHDEGWFAAVLEAFIIAVTIVVVAVPEGLPLAVTISLAFSTKKMLKDNNLIRHLAACETMGNATNICSDKTGTLTENKMKVVEGIFGGVSEGKASAKVKALVAKSVSLNSSAKLVEGSDHVIGNKTEGAMLLMLRGDGWDAEEGEYLRWRDGAKFGVEGGGKVFPFNSKKKSMSVIVADDAAPVDANVSKKKKSTRAKSKAAVASGAFTLFHKGAAERVLDRCTHYTNEKGDVKALTTAKKKAFAKTIHEYAIRALRCIALAHREGVEELVEDIDEVTGETCAEVLEER